MMVDRDIRIPTDGDSLRSRESQPFSEVNRGYMYAVENDKAIKFDMSSREDKDKYFRVALGLTKNVVHNPQKYHGVRGMRF